MIGSAPGRSSPVAEAAAEDRLHAERGKGRRRELGPTEPLGPSLVGCEVDGHKRVRAELVEGGLAFLPHLEILAADRLPRLLLQRVRRDDCHDAFGIRERQTFEQPAVDDRKDSGGEADAQAEREHRDQRQGRVLEQEAHSRTNIAANLIHRLRCPKRLQRTSCQDRGDCIDVTKTSREGSRNKWSAVRITRQFVISVLTRLKDVASNPDHDVRKCRRRRCLDGPILPIDERPQEFVRTQVL